MRRSNGDEPSGCINLPLVITNRVRDICITETTTLTVRHTAEALYSLQYNICLWNWRTCRLNICYCPVRERTCLQSHLSQHVLWLEPFHLTWSNGEDAVDCIQLSSGTLTLQQDISASQMKHLNMKISLDTSPSLINSRIWTSSIFTSEVCWVVPHVCITDCSKIKSTYLKQSAIPMHDVDIKFHDHRSTGSRSYCGAGEGDTYNEHTILPKNF